MATTVHMIGNAHIDPVWLWPWQAGLDEALASFRSAADRCDEYPEFIYTRGEAWLYRQVEKIDPGLFHRITRLIKADRWHVTGGMFVQPDANLPTEMGWRRQIARGCGYFQDRFNIRPSVCYNVDTFGHPATLPDILAGEGFGAYVFQRPNERQMSLPGQVFRWRGKQGGEVTAFRISGGYATRSDDLYGQIMLSLDASITELGHTMCFYGVGNHGGGPTKENIEYILEHRRDFEGAELIFSTPQAFFDAIAARRESLPVFEGELQHVFPGCYSVMHSIKKRQRRGEHRLDQCERVVRNFSLDSVEEARMSVQIADAWDDLLFTQFHDILAGTLAPSACESIEAMQGRALIAAEEIIVETTRRWARTELAKVNDQQIVIVNPDSSPWSGLLEWEPFLDFDAWRDRWLSDRDGQMVGCQMVQPECGHWLMNRIIFPVTIPPKSAVHLLLREGRTDESDQIVSDLTVSSSVLANRYIRLELNDSGIGAIFLQGRAVLGPGGIGLHLRDDHSDTWMLHSDHFSEPIRECFSASEWIVEEHGPLRARVRLDGRLGSSRVRWTVSLERDSRQFHLSLEINFDERYSILQIPIHLAEPPDEWIDGQAAGEVSREVGLTEWPVQGWSMLRLGTARIAMVTADAYSLSVNERCWQWTLLRSPKMAWYGGSPDLDAGHDQFADQGVHEFHFLFCTGNDVTADALHAAARQQAQPPIVFDRYEGMNRPPWRNNPSRRLWTGAEQRARRDGRMGHLADSGEKGAEEA